MAKMMEVVNFILANWAAMLAAFIAMLVAVMGVLKAFIAFMKLIPGEQGETVAQKIVDWMQKAVDFMGGVKKA